MNLCHLESSKTIAYRFGTDFGTEVTFSRIVLPFVGQLLSSYKLIRSKISGRLSVSFNPNLILLAGGGGGGEIHPETQSAGSSPWVGRRTP